MQTKIQMTAVRVNVEYVQPRSAQLAYAMADIAISSVTRQFAVITDMRCRRLI